MTEETTLAALRLNAGLATCPFCGGKGNIRWGGFGQYCQVRCENDDCGAEGAPKHNEEAAKCAWNTRVANV